jgi:hypothetical protein
MSAPTPPATSRRARVEWSLGLTGLALTVGLWGFVVVKAARVREAKAAKAAAWRASSPPELAPVWRQPPPPSWDACLAAWRRSAETLRGLPAEAQRDGQLAELEARIAALGDAGPNGTRASTWERTCAPDDRGAWALAIRPPAQKKEDCGDVVVDAVRIDTGGGMTSLRVAAIAPDGCGDTDANASSAHLDALRLFAVPDMNGDRLPEARLKMGDEMSLGYGGVPEVGALYTSRGGAVTVYPGTEGLPIMDARDENSDGRPDVLYAYAVEGGYEAGCGAPMPIEHSPELVAFTQKDGGLSFDGLAERTAARKACPQPPASAEDDAFCALLWGFEARAVPDFDAAHAKCVADYAEEDAKMREPGAGCGLPSRDACGHFFVWKSLARERFPTRVWPPPAGDRAARSDEENAALASAEEALVRARRAMAGRKWDEAIAAYRAASAHDEPDVVASELAYAYLRSGDGATAAGQLVALADRIADRRVRAAALYNLGLAEEALGERRSATRAFQRSVAVRSTPEARAKLGGKGVCPVDVVAEGAASRSLDEWKESAGDEAEQPPVKPDGDWHIQRSVSDRRFVAWDAHRYPPAAPDALYQLDAATGRVRRCLVAEGCTCAAASPCVAGPARLPPPGREVVVFTADGSRAVARASWPEDVDPSHEIDVSVAKGELAVEGLGCNERIKLSP